MRKLIGPVYLIAEDLPRWDREIGPMLRWLRLGLHGLAVLAVALLILSLA